MNPYPHHHPSLGGSPHHAAPAAPVEPQSHHGYGGPPGGPVTGQPSTPDHPGPHSPAFGGPGAQDTGSAGPFSGHPNPGGMQPSNGHHHGAGGMMGPEQTHHRAYQQHPHMPGHMGYPPVNHNNNCTLKQEPGTGVLMTGNQQCAGCGLRINERWLLHALDRYWHNSCLKCTSCGAALAEIGQSCYSRGNMILCKSDYARIFGSTGACAGCGQTIQATEMVAREGGNVFHTKCFACSKCAQQLTRGDRYYMINGAPVCEADFHKLVKSSAVGAAAAATGNGGTTMRKGKVGRPRRSRE